MTDITQGADAPDDNALFNDATTSTLAKFENPEPTPKEADPPKPVIVQGDPPKPGDPPPKEADAPVPAGRLREESEARRRAERERDELRARLDVFARPQPPAKEPPKPTDLFENPKGFVQEEVKPLLEQMRADFQSQREAMSLDFAIQRHGDDKVGAARQALEQGMQRGDANAWAAYNRAMQSHDPYGIIFRWHQDGEALRTIGGDITKYRQSVLDEAMKDPEFQKRVFEAAKGQAASAGNHTQRAPSKPLVSSSPSLGNIGAGGTDDTIIEPSDEQLFRAATTAKRR